MQTGRYKAAHIAHIADVYIEAERNASEAARRLRSEGEPYANLKAERIRGWLKNNTHNFNAEIVRARERLGERMRRRSVADPIPAIEKLIGDINERHEALKRAYDEAVTIDALGENEFHRVENLLLKQEGQMAELLAVVEKMKNPKEGDAAVQAVIAFVQVLINRASPRQRDVIVQVARPLLPEGGTDA